MSKKTRTPEVKRKAFVLSIQSRKKSWARRWLRQNAYINEMHRKTPVSAQ